MSKNLVYVGVDVDDQAFHFSAVSADGEILSKGIRALCNAKSLLNKIRKAAPRAQIEVGYEAGYLGYTLARDLSKLGVFCRIIAPTSIRRCPNDRVKNDRLDSLRLAQGMQRGEFSFVVIPSEAQESDRQMIRARSFLVAQRSDLKRHILNQCRLLHLDYKKDTKGKEYWTKAHRDWLDQKLANLHESMHVALSCLLSSLENLEQQILSLEAQITNISAKAEYRKSCEALSCFKGVSTTTAMTIITEVFDIRRFEHPKKLAAFCGLDIREYSSGGKQLQFGISKMGNHRLRTALVESCQHFGKGKTPSKRKEAARRGSDPKFIDIANRCQERLYKKGHRLLAREKNRNKVKVACAREMIGFIWEAMQLAA